MLSCSVLLFRGC